MEDKPVSQKSNNTETPPHINGDFDFWKDAMTLVNSILPPNMGDIFIEHMKTMNFNENEKRYFRECFNKAFEFHTTTAFLKSLS